MSRTLSIRMYFKQQKSDGEGKVPIYVHITVDGNGEGFSLSRKIFPYEWSQPKQKCIGKSPECQCLNARIAEIHGDLTTLFDRFPVQEVVKAKQLINLYHGADLEKEQQLEKGSNYHQNVLAIIDQYLALKNKQKKALTKTNAGPHPDRITEEFETLIRSIEDFLRQSLTRMDDSVVDKTPMDAQNTFLLKFLYKVLKGTASHETFRKWVSTKNTFLSFLHYRYKVDD